MSEFQVLIVDDNKDAADSMAACLRCYGFNIRVAYSGQAAINNAHEVQPDVVLCDLGLPELDGYEVASRLIAELPQRPLLVAVTARPEREVIGRGGPVGFDHYFLKPAEPVEIGALLSDYVIHRRQPVASNPPSTA